MYDPVAYNDSHVSDFAFAVFVAGVYDYIMLFNYISQCSEHLASKSATPGIFRDFLCLGYRQLIIRQPKQTWTVADKAFAFA